MIDSFVIVALIVLFCYIFSIFGNVPDLAKKLAFIFIFFSYDPIFTSVFGGTMGHYLFGIRVKDENDWSKNINILMALLRYFMKIFLGVFSLLTVSINRKGKAIHDMIAQSIVVYKHQKENPNYRMIRSSQDTEFHS